MGWDTGTAHVPNKYLEHQDSRYRHVTRDHLFLGSGWPSVWTLLVSRIDGDILVESEWRWRTHQVLLPLVRFNQLNDCVAGMVHVSEESQTESSNRCGLTADDETIDDYTDSEDSDEIGGHLLCSNLCVVLTLTQLTWWGSAMCGPGEQIAFLERQVVRADLQALC